MYFLRDCSHYSKVSISFLQVIEVKLVGFLCPLLIIEGLLNHLRHPAKASRRNFFKVSTRENDFPFFLSKNGEPKFSLYWNSRPNIVTGYEYHQLCQREKLEVDYLERTDWFE